MQQIKKIISVLGLAFIISVFIITDVKAQRDCISKFTLPAFQENFDSVIGYRWPQIADSENELITANGEYFMRRKNNIVPYAVLLKWQQELTDFCIETAVKLAPNQQEMQTLGIIFMVQNNGKDAYIFEINDKNQYRIKYLKNGFYNFVSQNEDGVKGWVKHKAISKPDNFNKIKVCYTKGYYYFLINDEYITELYNDKYKSGGMGLIIGPSTLAKADFFNVYTGDSLTINHTDTEKKIEHHIADMHIDTVNNKTDIDNQEIAQSPKNESKKDISINNDSLLQVIEKQNAIIRNLNYFKTLATKNKDSALVSYFNKVYFINDSLRMELTQAMLYIEKLKKEKMIYADSTQNTDLFLFKIDSLQQIIINQRIEQYEMQDKFKFYKPYKNKHDSLIVVINKKNTEIESLKTNQNTNTSTNSNDDSVAYYKQQLLKKQNELNKIKNTLSSVANTNSKDLSNVVLIDKIKAEIKRSNYMLEQNKVLNDSIINLYKENQNLKIQLIEKGVITE